MNEITLQISDEGQKRLQEFCYRHRLSQSEAVLRIVDFFMQLEEYKIFDFSFIGSDVHMTPGQRFDLFQRYERI